jgi:hypothetical protein
MRSVRGSGDEQGRRHERRKSWFHPCTELGVAASPHVTQPSRASQSGAFTRSRSRSAPRALARVASAACSSTCEMAKPTWISTQSPSSTPSGPPGHQRDVDDAAYARHVDQGQEPAPDRRTRRSALGSLGTCVRLPADQVSHDRARERIEHRGQRLAQLGPDRRADGLRAMEHELRWVPDSEGLTGAGLHR